MITGRRSTDWLRAPSAQPDDAERRAGDRRERDRRAPRRPIDPLFAITLINQVAPEAGDGLCRYKTAPAQYRRGVVVNLRA